jgi:hypothetical protein
MHEPRDSVTRNADTLAALGRAEADVWVATARDAGDGAEPWLVPLSLCWSGERVVVAVEPTSRTAVSAVSSGRARLALGPTRDVVMIDAVLEASVDASAVDDQLGGDYARQSGGWDPREEDKPFLFLIFRPLRIQAWREVNEIADRTLMRNGEWIV